MKMYHSCPNKASDYRQDLNKAFSVCVGAPVEELAHFCKCNFCVCVVTINFAGLSSPVECFVVYFMSSVWVWLSVWLILSIHSTNMVPASLTMWHLLPFLVILCHAFVIPGWFDPDLYIRVCGAVISSWSKCKAFILMTFNYIYYYRPVLELNSLSKWRPCLVT